MHADPSAAAAPRGLRGWWLAALLSLLGVAWGVRHALEHTVPVHGREGPALVERLAHDLRRRFPGTFGAFPKAERVAPATAAARFPVGDMLIAAHAPREQTPALHALWAQHLGKWEEAARRVEGAAVSPAVAGWLRARVNARRGQPPDPR